jgi:hypothetical protein
MPTEEKSDNPGRIGANLIYFSAALLSRISQRWKQWASSSAMRESSVVTSVIFALPDWKNPGADS